MFSELINIFSYTFMQRALLCGIFISLCSALLGVSLVLKQYSMIGDGLSHIGFGALAIAAALNLAPLAVAIPTVIIAAFFLLRLSDKSRLHGDSGIAIISTVALAVGVIVVSKQGANIDIENYLFGSILSVSKSDTVASIVLSLAVVVLFVLFYHKIFAVTFDESFSKATGINASAYKMIIAILTALTVVIGMRLMGTLLISSLIIFPPICAMRVMKTFKGVTVFSAIITTFCLVVGLVSSVYFDAPAGATIVITHFISLVVFSLIGHIKYSIGK